MRLLFSHGQAASNKDFQSNTKFVKRTCEIKLRAVALGAQTHIYIYEGGHPASVIPPGFRYYCFQSLLTRLPESFAVPEKAPLKVDQNVLTQRHVSEMTAKACLEEKGIDVRTLLLDAIAHLSIAHIMTYF